MLHTALDEITLAPTLSGSHGRAWAVDLDAALARSGKSRQDGGDVATWIVEAPWAHPVWHSYWINLVHLRPIPGAPPAMLYLEGATHELWLYALDPEGRRQEMIETGAMRALAPINFAAQIVATSDAAAMHRVERAVQAICDGNLSPDTDFREVWIARFGGNMVRS